MHGRVWRRLPFVCGLFWALSLGLFSFPLAQEWTRGGESLRLDLGMGQSPPGAKVLIPATLKVPDAVDVASVDIRVTFPRKQVSFVEVKRGIAADAVNAEVAAAVEDDDSGNPDSAVLRVSVKVTEKGTFIPNGNVADLVFKIDAKVSLKDIITLQNRSSGTSAREPGGPLDGMSGTDGEIIVDETALVFSCFFYMH